MTFYLSSIFLMSVLILGVASYPSSFPRDQNSLFSVDAISLQLTEIAFAQEDSEDNENEEEEREYEIDIDAVVEDGGAKVVVEIDDEEFEFEFTLTATEPKDIREEIKNEILQRTELTREQLSFLEIEFEDEEFEEIEEELEDLGIEEIGEEFEELGIEKFEEMELPKYNETTASIQTISEQGNEVQIPDWIRNNAEWWAEGAINDNDFTLGIQFLIKENIMQIPKTVQSSDGEDSGEIPDWIKNNAEWWSQSLISDDDFVKGIEYLIGKGIIQI